MIWACNNWLILHFEVSVAIVLNVVLDLFLV